MSVNPSHILHNKFDDKALLTKKNQKNQTPLIRAIFENQINEAKYLLTLTSSEELTSFTMPDSSGMKLLDGCLLDFFVQYEMLELLVTEIRKRKLFPEQFKIHASGHTAAKLALLRGDPKIAALFGIDMKSKEYIDYRFAKNRSVLAEAVNYGYYLGVSNLLYISEYRKIMVVNENGHTPLIEAAIRGHAGIVKLLEKNGAGQLLDLSSYCDLNGGNTLIHLACGKEYGCSDSGLRLLFQFPEFQRLINEENTAGEVPLVVASHNITIFRLLLQFGADIEYRNSKDMNVMKMIESQVPPPDEEVWKVARAAKELMELARLKTAKPEDVSRIEKLIQEGASILQADAEKNLPIHLATRVGNYFFIELLSGRGALLSRNRRGKNPLQVIKSGTRNAGLTKSILNVLLANKAIEKQDRLEKNIRIEETDEPARDDKPEALDALECTEITAKSKKSDKSEKSGEAIIKLKREKEDVIKLAFLCIEAAIDAALEIEDTMLRNEKLYELTLFIRKREAIHSHFGTDKILEILSKITLGTAVFGKARFEMAKINYELYQGLKKFGGKEAKAANEKLRQAFEYIHQATDVKESEEFRKKIITECAGPLFQEQVFGDFSRAEDCLALIEKTVESDEKILRENEELAQYKLQLEEELKRLEEQYKEQGLTLQNDKKRKCYTEGTFEFDQDTGTADSDGAAKRARTMVPELQRALGMKRELSESSNTSAEKSDSESTAVKVRRFE